MLWVCFSAEGTEGLVRVEEKFNAPKYRDSLNENPVQCIQNFRRAEGLPSKRTMDLNTQQEWLIDNSVNVLGGGGGVFAIHLQSCDNSVFALSIWCMECRLM